jgi:N-acetylmuramic acid 6-phosphate etherase
MDTNASPDAASREPLILGIEGGGTKTEWVLARRNGDAIEVEREGKLSASNLKLITDEDLLQLFSVLPHDGVTHVGAYLAGCGTEEDRTRLRKLVAKSWPDASAQVGSDRDSAMAVAFGSSDGIAVIAGTGAAVHGRKEGQVQKAGGWGQLLGDRGGGYHLAMQGLRSVLSHYDMSHTITPLAQNILQMLALNRLSDLVDWAMQADKMSVARLAPAIFDAARKGEPEMLAIVQGGAQVLAEFTNAVAQRLDFLDPCVKLVGGLWNHPDYVALYRYRLSTLLPKAQVERCGESGAIGAAWLALQTQQTGAVIAKRLDRAPLDKQEIAAAITEQRNPRSLNLDRLAALDLVDLFVTEEDEVTRALGACREPLAAGVDLVSNALVNGGRLFYVGAGTSGRLGVLDASEIPPTFGAPPELVQGIIAGGLLALHRAVEGAEDQPEAGAQAVAERGVREGDVVCGLAASGRTPFVIGALQKARALGAKTMLITCNPARKKSEATWDVEVDLPTGPELVTGSTRLKAGTATKIALNILSTGAMIRQGRVRSNLMINVQVSNEKLRDRGVRLVSTALGIPYDDAENRLAAAGWNVRSCLEAAAGKSEMLGD